MSGRWSLLEFFAGAGMARVGLGPEWECRFANDISPAKAESYIANFGDRSLVCADVANLTTDDIPAGRADAAWASPPCQDLSEAGGRAGLDGRRSGAFWPFLRLIEGLRAEQRAPRLIVYENVTGLIDSHGGRDFEAVVCALNNAGYRCGALLIDAVHFVPQSRVRVFVIGVDASLAISAELVALKPSLPFQTPPLALLCDPLGDPRWDAGRHPLSNPIWWRLPIPPMRNTTLADIIEDDPAPAPAKAGVRWHTLAETNRILAMMTEGNLAKIEAAKRAGKRMTGGLYRRTRPAKDGAKVSRWEVRFDGLAGCLRVPTGGSSRQNLMVVEGESVRSRLLSPRECARLMGLPDDYVLPSNVNEALHLLGDGVCVPVVRFLAAAILEPILMANVESLGFPGHSLGMTEAVTTTFVRAPVDPWRLAKFRA